MANRKLVALTSLELYRHMTFPKVKGLCIQKKKKRKSTYILLTLPIAIRYSRFQKLYLLSPGFLDI